MIPHRGPRIGRADRLAELAALQDRRVVPAWGPQDPPLRPPPAVAQLLASPPPSPLPVSRAALATAAAQLAEQIEPLPNVLAELGVRISRHCAVTRRDAELAEAVDFVRGRSFDLWLAVCNLQRAGRGAGA